jgi:hypothetical protein
MMAALPNGFAAALRSREIHAADTALPARSLLPNDSVRFLRPCSSAGMIPQFNISKQTAIRMRATGEKCWQLKLPAVIEPYRSQQQTTANHSNAHAGGLSERHAALPFGEVPPRVWHQKQKTPTRCHKDVDKNPRNVAKPQLVIGFDQISTNKSRRPNNDGARDRSRQ